MPSQLNQPLAEQRSADAVDYSPSQPPPNFLYRLWNKIAAIGIYFIGTIEIIVGGLLRIYEFPVWLSHIADISKEIGGGLIAGGVLTLILEPIVRRRHEAEVAEIKDEYKSARNEMQKILNSSIMALNDQTIQIRTAQTEAILKALMPVEIFDAIRMQRVLPRLERF